MSRHSPLWASRASQVTTSPLSSSPSRTSGATVSSAPLSLTPLAPAPGWLCGHKLLPDAPPVTALHGCLSGSCRPGRWLLQEPAPALLPQETLQPVSIQTLKQKMQRRYAGRRRLLEPQRRHHLRAVITPPLGNGIQAPGPAQHRAHGQGQDRPYLVPPAMRIPRVRHLPRTSANVRSRTVCSTCSTVSTPSIHALPLPISDLLPCYSRATTKRPSDEYNLLCGRWTDGII